jgi:electron transfer flavoprotein alpha/beta subunit
VKIVVCIKEILDPDIPSTVFEVDEAANAVREGVALRYVISPFDAQAIELALRLRDKGGDCTISLITLGGDSARAIVKYGLALGADDAFMLVDDAFDGGDSHVTARALAAAIHKIGGADLVLTGRQAADRDAGVVGPGIAELLELPLVTFAADVAVEGPLLVVERALGDRTEFVEVPMPALVTVSHEVGAVRHASLRETMKAARKPVTVWTPGDLGLADGDVGVRGARVTLERLYVPVSDVACEFVVGDTPAELAATLVDRLTAERLIG